MTSDENDRHLPAHPTTRDQWDDGARTGLSIRQRFALSAPPMPIEFHNTLVEDLSTPVPIREALARWPWTWADDVLDQEETSS